MGNFHMILAIYIGSVFMLEQKIYKSPGYKIEEYIKITEFYTMFECFRENGYNFPGESHKYWECVYVTEGKVRVSGDDRVYNMKKGDIIFHKPYELHKYYVNKENSANLFIFSFCMEGAYTSFFENKVFSLNIEQTQIMNNILNFIHEKEKSFDGILPDYVFDCILYLAVLEASGSDMLIITNLFHLLFLSLHENFKMTTESKNVGAILFKTAVNFMNENINQSLTVREIAEHCCISITGLKKIFSKYAGGSIHKYFLKLKINHAISLLSEGHKVNEVAELLGFSSQPYFSQAFKRETGFSPGEIK